jgi:hypothetical protein
VIMMSPSRIHASRGAFFLGWLAVARRRSVRLDRLSQLAVQRVWG